MQKWEYLRLITDYGYPTHYIWKVEVINEKCLSHPYSNIDGYIKKLGEEGWELVSIVGNAQAPLGSACWVFKRPKI